MDATGDRTRTSRRVSALTCLDEPARRELFELVGRSETPVSRDEAASALSMPRSTVSFHLDRLVAEGLLVSEFRKLGHRDGPGSGRPAKLYRLAVDEVSASVPERRYDLAGELMAAAISESDRTGEPVTGVLNRLAYRRGERLGAEAGSAEAMLRSGGYAPEPDGDGGYVLGNCPFHQLSARHADVACGLNARLLAGALAGAGDDRRAVPDPGGAYCCARIIADS